MASVRSAPGQPLEPVESGAHFAQSEETVMDFWTSTDAFKQSLRMSEGREKRFVFLDGPPFATGTPHHGHLLAGTIKDVVTRWAHQTGHYVERRFGWDTHGLPVEYEIDKANGITGPADVEAMGIGTYNAKCREIVMRYSGLWEKTVARMGRWIDFENDYKTLDPTFMESVWWVFSELHRKGLVFEGFKVMPYSTGCNTPLSNFESGQNYKDVDDPTVVATFPLVDEPDVSLLAWTTTPWTLPSNLALCVNPTMTYVRVRDCASGRVYIMAESRLCQLFETAPRPAGADDASASSMPGGKKNKKKKKKNKKNKKNKAKAEDGASAAPASASPSAEAQADADAEPKGPEYEVLESFLGSTLLGKRYKPLFPYLESSMGESAYRVVMDDYVTDGDGTGIVHNAPAHGEDDYRVCIEHEVVVKGGNLPMLVDENGCFTAEVTDFAGQYVKDADDGIIAHLEAQGRVVQKKRLVHSYPHCWRSNTPLIYRAVPSWFVNVPAIKDRLLANNEQTYWVPAFVKEKRFHNWLVDARDWSVSRNRYWGTPLPIWRSDDGEELVVIGSVAELEEKSGVSGITDLHRDSIDHITIPSARGADFPPLKRVPQVFDCWFESGSMPYAQQHYPFENKEEFEANFPADFIAEGLDQTRGWFYTLMVLSTALFDKPAFRNLVVNGLVLAADGSKMSKSKRNYDEPMDIINEHGADAMRMYLINSPLVRAEPMAFTTDGVRDVVRALLIPWQNTYRFFVEQARRFERRYGHNIDVEGPRSSNLMDRWVLANFESTLEFVSEEMAAYRLYTVMPRLVEFIGELSSWYVRFNKSRLKGEEDDKEDTQFALVALFRVLINLCRLMAPFTPFIVESQYQNLKRLLPLPSADADADADADANADVSPDADLADSVHFLHIPPLDQDVRDPAIVRAVRRLQAVVEVGRMARNQVDFDWRTPTPSVTVVHRSEEFTTDLASLSDYLDTELNARRLDISNDVDAWGRFTAAPEYKTIGSAIEERMGTEPAGKKARKAAMSAVCKAVRKLTSAQILDLEEAGEMTFDSCPEFPLRADFLKVSLEFTGDKTKYAVATDAKVGVLVLVSTELTQDCKNEGAVRSIASQVNKLRKEAGLVTEDRVAVYYSLQGEQLAAAVQERTEYLASRFQWRSEADRADTEAVLVSGQYELLDGSVQLSLVRL